jgi:hypothetical protein
MTWFLDLAFLKKLQAGEGTPACYEPGHVARTVDVDVAIAAAFFAADRSYALVSEPDYGFYTGTIESRTVLACFGTPRSSEPEPDGVALELVYFDERGVFAGAERMAAPSGDDQQELLEELGFEDHPIQVRSFIHPTVELLALVPLPFHFHELLEQPDAIDPDERVELTAQLRQWIADGCAVFHWGNAYFISREGDVESS